LEGSFKLSNYQVEVSASIGIVLGDDRSQVKELIHDSDSAMYAAKAAGKNRYKLFEAIPEHRRLVLAKHPMNITGEKEESRFAPQEPESNHLSH